MSNAGVVDENIQPVKLVFHGGEERCNGMWIADIADKRQYPNLAPQFPAGFIQS